MMEERVCPVCERQGLTDCDNCPQCDADLTCFQALEQLHTEQAVPTVQESTEKIVPPNRSGVKGIVYACFLGAVLVLVALSFIMGRFERRLTGMDNTIVAAINVQGLQQDVSTSRIRINKLQINYEASISRMEKGVRDNGVEIKRIDADLTSLNGELEERFAAVSPKEKDDTFLYYARKTDTLWGIARRFYGKGKYYPFIMEQNPHLAIRDSIVGSRMKLISDSDPVMLANMYSRKTEWKNGTLLWKYVVQPKDTQDSIYDRFIVPGTSGQVFFDADVKIIPFETINIILH